jgi:hypothetical protein
MKTAKLHAHQIFANRKTKLTKFNSQSPTVWSLDKRSNLKKGKHGTKNTHTHTQIPSSRF